MVLDLVLRIATASALAATALRLATKHRQRPAGLPGALLCGGLMAYLAAPRLIEPDRGSLSSFVILALAIANPPLIWLVARGLFREGVSVGRRQIIAALAAVVVGLLAAYDVPRRVLGATPLVELVGRVVPHGMALGFILLAIIHAQRDVRSDLVEPRRRLRVVFITSIAAYAALVAVVEIALRGEPAPVALEFVHLALLLGAALAAAVLIYRRGEELLGRPPAPRQQPIDPLLAELEAWIARQGFLEPEQSVAALARTLRTQEYKLRRLLNGELGFRNFNDFVHRHRIQVACARLTQPGNDSSILELSLAVGYRSLATFNRAFKELTGLSPSEYRARHRSPKASK